MSLLHRPRYRDHQNLVEAQDPSTANSEQVAQPPAASQVPRRRTSALKFFASSTAPKVESPSGSQKTWEKKYLKDLRANRPARPGGSRPQPGQAVTSTPEPYSRASSAMSFRPSCSTRQADPIAKICHERSTSALSHRRAQSDLPSMDTSVVCPGQLITQQPHAGVSSRDFSHFSTSSKTSRIVPSGTYRESGMRWMEKQEARSLREALEDMDLRDEARIHGAAQDEASELVLAHRNHGLPDRNADQLHNYKQHLEKGAHTRSQRPPRCTEQDAKTDGDVQGQGSAPDHSASGKGDSKPSRGSRNTSSTAAEPSKGVDDTQSNRENGHVLWDPPEKKAYMSLTFAKPLPKPAGRRRSSGPRARDVSGGLFRNPDDKIYEEPDDVRDGPQTAPVDGSRIPAPLMTKTRNTISETSTASQPFLRSKIASNEEKKRAYRFEIHRNPPSQSRNPSYLNNALPSTLPDSANANLDETNIDSSSAKNGIEIRGDDIKAATSMRMKDRSPKLPLPTVVSGQPGRPIVSFDKDWKSKDTGKQETASSFQSGLPTRPRFKPQMPSTTASAPAIPTINVPDPPLIQTNEASPSDAPFMPSISVSDVPIPTIALPDDPPTTRSLPTPSRRPRPSPANRPLPHHSSTTPVHSSKLHWSPSSRRATAQCAACALPIEGRIVSAAFQRFHPYCFTCYHCAEPLECVAFYPEPDTHRSARLARIEARADGSDVLEEKAGETAEDDGDAGLRFYCHLDYHELYSPRCRSCKTPIETEVVLACGGSWHVGHFFCAECGDPFDAKTPFVEKDGYAWCVSCHAGRFSGKCKGCRKPVVDGGVSALGGEWHVNCFCCVVSVFI